MPPTARASSPRPTAIDRWPASHHRPRRSRRSARVIPQSTHRDWHPRCRPARAQETATPATRIRWPGTLPTTSSHTLARAPPSHRCMCARSSDDHQIAPAPSTGTDRRPSAPGRSRRWDDGVSRSSRRCVRGLGGSSLRALRARLCQFPTSNLQFPTIQLPMLTHSQIPTLDSQNLKLGIGIWEWVGRWQLGIGIWRSPQDSSASHESSVVAEWLRHPASCRSAVAPHRWRGDFCGKHKRLVRFAEPHGTIADRHIRTLERHEQGAVDALMLARNRQIDHAHQLLIHTDDGRRLGFGPQPSPPAAGHVDTDAVVGPFNHWLSRLERTVIDHHRFATVNAANAGAGERILMAPIREQKGQRLRGHGLGVHAFGLVALLRWLAVHSEQLPRHPGRRLVGINARIPLDP